MGTVTSEGAVAADAAASVSERWRETGWELGCPTMPELLRRWEEIAPERVAMRAKRRGRWQEWTFGRWADQVRRLGAGLLELGVQSQDRVAIQSENRPEWLTAYVATQGLGAVPFGVYPTNPANELAYQLRDSGARLLFAEDQEQLDKALATLEECPTVQSVIVFDRRGTQPVIETDPRVIHLDDVLELGAQRLQADPTAWDHMSLESDPDDLATIIYTSGTTGPPKGAMLTWRNVNAAIEVQSRVFGIGTHDEVLSYLPLCHVAELNMSYHNLLGCGVVVNFAESVDSVQADLRAVRPTLLFAVPRISEKLLSSIEDRVADATWAKRTVHRFARDLSLWLVDRRIAREPTTWTWWERGVQWLLWLLVHRALRKHTGTSRVRLAICGGAPVSSGVLRYLLAIGVPIVEAYGMTEASGTVATNMPDDLGLGTVGRVPDSLELRLADDSEILLRGEAVFLGYWQQPETTAETIDADGWLHTGDVGKLDESGRLQLTDRKKDIIITAGGKNLSPSEIENRVKSSPFVKEAVVIGDGRRYVTALIQIEYEPVAHWAKRQQLPVTTFHDLTEHPQVHQLIAGVVEQANEQLAQVEQIKAFRLLPRELDQDDDELTATQKVRRSVVSERFADLIDEMYR